MKHLLSLLLIFGFIHQSVANDIREEYKAINPYFNSNLDSAYMLAFDLLKRSEANDNTLGIIKGNLYLGYIQYLRGEFGKSVLYCLEGIRKSDDANYEGIHNDKMWLRRNIAITYREFGAHDLATQYNLEAIDIALDYNDTNQIIYLRLNQALTYQGDEQFDLAIQFLNDILPLIDANKALESEIINQIGLVYMEKGAIDQAIHYFESLLEYPSEANLFKAKALHNLGESYYRKGETTKAIQYALEGISLIESINNVEKYGQFLSYMNIGQFYLESGNLIQASGFLSKAELIFEHASWDAKSFKLFKLISDLHYQNNDNVLGKRYSELYFEKIQNHLETQEELLKNDKEYNLDLITKRYFAEVDKQEQIASIMFWSKISSGSLLTILLLVIAFNRYEKLKLRRTIERELLNLRIIE